MPLRFAGRVFAPSILASVLTLLLFAGLVALGNWQLSRMHEKQALFAAFEAGGRDSVPLPASGGAPFQRVTAYGRYDSGRQILLDNMTHGGRAGYQVLTPLKIDGDGTVLVNRGWLPLGANRQTLPEVDVAETPRAVTGRLGELPRPGVRLRADAANTPGWPRVMSFPESSDIRAALGRPMAAPVILLEADQRDGFVREWRPSTFPPERHLGYAVTWFSLAATLLVIYVVVNLRPVRPHA